MEFQDVIRQRYASRQFEERPIPETKIDELLELVRLTPSGLNLQPWKIKVITDQKTKDQLYPVSGDQPWVATTCSHLLVFCANTDLAPLVAKIDEGMRAAGVPDQARAHVVELATDLSRQPLEVRRTYAQNMVFLALGTAINGAKALGFDSCPMTNFQPEGYARILNIPAHLIPTALCPLGYGTDKPMPKRRLTKAEIVF